MNDNYYGEEGCCLTCDDAEPGCLCYACNCTKCEHYVSDFYGKGHCGITDGNLTWEDYEDMAIQEKERALKYFGENPKNLKATFSNGTITKEVYYANAKDIPHKITYNLEQGGYRTLLLKKVEPWILRGKNSG